MNNFTNTSKSVLNDMATMTKLIQPFTGTSGEDASKWLDNFRTVIDMVGMDDQDTIRVLVLSLKEEALTWATALLKKTRAITLAQLSEAFEARYSSQQTDDKILKKFLYSGEAKSANEFHELIWNATYLWEKRLMLDNALIKLIIAKVPAALKSTLYHASCQSQDWMEFARASEAATWIAFPEVSMETLIAQGMRYNDYRPEQMELVAAIHSKPAQHNRSSTGSYCTVHGNGGHSTDECRSIKKLKERSRSNQRRRPGIASVTQDQADSGEGKDIKNDFSLYSIHTKKPNRNLFFTKVVINNKSHEALFDTGADLSVINASKVPDNVKVLKTERKAVSVSEHNLDIVGEIKDFPIKIGDKQYTLNAVVTTNYPKFIILGSPFILANRAAFMDQFMSTASTKDISVNSVQQQDLDSTIASFEPLFQTEISNLTLCTAAQHSIDTGDARPIAKTGSRIPYNLERELQEEIDKNLRLGIIQPSKSPWCSRIVPVEKKDGTTRMCVDYRDLNKSTVKDKYPIPRIDTILDALRGARIFSSLDATSGYYQIAMDPKDIEKTAFSWRHGLFEYTRMPFGLCNAPATFQRAMDHIFKKERFKFVIPYFDDIIIYSETPEEHQEHLKIVSGRLKAAGVALNKKKCKFARPEILILGHVIAEGIVKPDPEKVRAINEFNRPNNIKELRSFLGLANYCRAFIPMFAAIAGPLFNLLKGETKRSVKSIKWNHESDQSFRNTRRAISETTVRSQPDMDKDFIVITDASSTAIGGILAQKDDEGNEKMIYAFSKAMDKAQLNYSVTDKELLALVKTVEHFRHYLLGRKFVLRTDHRALAYLWESKNPNSRLLRWSLAMQEYDFTPVYIKGETNMADVLSRPVELRVNQITAKNRDDIDDSNKEVILSDYHQALGHGSSNSMKFAIKQKYTWASMYKDIDNFVQRCETCLKAGGAIVNTKNRVIKVDRPNQLWECDLIGILPETKRGNKFIFVAIDHYSKWVETRALKTKDMASVAGAVEELIVNRHGIPESILTDNGAEFNNAAIKNIQKNYGIEWKFNSPGHHETVGAVERANQTLFNKVKKLCNYGKIPWDRALPQATLATNLSFNRSIQTSPFIMKHGKLPDLDIDKRLGIIDIEQNKIAVKQKRDDHFQEYSEKDIEKGKVLIKKQLQLGDPVLIYKEKLGDKLGSSWHPGFRITEKILPDAYLVTNGQSTLRLNKSHIRKDFSIGEGDVVTP